MVTEDTIQNNDSKSFETRDIKKIKTMSNTVSQDYHVVEKVLTDGDIPVTLYANKITGLRVVTAYVECPIVKADMAFATEAFDDDGLPHTLEHLIFLGSEDYPYKGILDFLSLRCLSNGTNAFTDVDYTNYTVSTAGSDGFLNLLPIYLDHVLFPLLTDSAYMTEVHHINARGEDAGVVYCEMQGKENSGDSRCYLEMLRSMYPGRSGYKSETGGILENLRTSTNNEKVRNYHKQFYHAKNLCVIITGPCEAKDIFAAIKPIEDKIVQKQMHLMPFERPWQTPVEPLSASVRRKIQYSSDTDDDGLVSIGFRGPSVVENFKELVAISILLDYLSSTAVSPIQRDFVECDEPYCSCVSHSFIENSTSCFYLSFESVGKQYLDQVIDKLLQLLHDIRNQKEKFDIDRLKTIINRKKVQILSVAETSPHSLVHGPVIGHFLFGTGELKERAQEIPLLDEFIKCDADYWLSLIEKYMIGDDSRYVCIVGEPSPELMKTMSEAEEKRLNKQKEDLKDELPLLGDRLKKAIEMNEIPAPIEVLNSISTPSMENIIFHPIERHVIEENKTPFRIQYDSIKTNFVTIYMITDSSKCLTKTDRLYLPILTEILLECPIERDGNLIPYEKIVAELFSDTVAYGTSIGLSLDSKAGGDFSQLVNVMLQVEINKYERAVRWFHELLYKTVLTPERIKTVATRMVSDISQHKRSGTKVMQSVSNALIYQSNSNKWAVNFMRQQKFLKKLLKDLKSQPEQVQKDISRIRDQLFQPGNLLVHMGLNKDKIDVSKVLEPWLNFLPEHYIKASGQHIQLDLITPSNKLVCLSESPKRAVVGIGSVESNFMRQMVRSIDDFNHPDLAAVYVLIEYLSQIEGPLWRQIRGLGLAYHYGIELSPAQGLLYFLLADSTRLIEAYNKTIEIVNQHTNGEENFDDNLIESSKTLLIFELIKLEKSASSKSLQSLVAHLRSLSIDFNKELIKRVAEVTKEDLQRVGPLYLKPLFKDPEVRTAVCCHPSKLDGVISGLKAAGCPLERINLEEAMFINSME